MGSRVAGSKLPRPVVHHRRSRPSQSLGHSRAQQSASCWGLQLSSCRRFGIGGGVLTLFWQRGSKRPACARTSIRASRFIKQITGDVFSVHAARCPTWRTVGTWTSHAATQTPTSKVGRVKSTSAASHWWLVDWMHACCPSKDNLVPCHRHHEERQQDGRVRGTH
jgi:hypothetical protein